MVTMVTAREDTHRCSLSIHIYIDTKIPLVPEEPRGKMENTSVVCPEFCLKAVAISHPTKVSDVHLILSFYSVPNSGSSNTRLSGVVTTTGPQVMTAEQLYWSR